MVTKTANWPRREGLVREESIAFLDLFSKRSARISTWNVLVFYLQTQYDWVIDQNVGVDRGDWLQSSAIDVACWSAHFAQCYSEMDVQVASLM